MRFNLPFVMSVSRRDLRLYFSNPTGYVFITLFIFLSAAAAFWQQRFFLNNLANLDELNMLFPYLLLFFVPAITMGVWADERKQGTDELLLTLPATDLEVALGKYLSTLGIYTSAVLLSLSHLVVLFWLGRPDVGLMLGNYVGYWLLGATFISVGMLASMLSANVTIAFVSGAALCAVFVYIEPIAGAFGSGAERAVANVAVFGAFGDFARGVVSLSGLLYFASITALSLYLNVVLLGRRHWPRQADGYKMWTHHVVRAVSLVVAIFGLNAMAGRGSARADVTAENLHSLSDRTRMLIRQIPEERPVFIQAFLSPDVPKQYVQTRANLVGFLREINATAGDRVQLVVHETNPFSREARDAREKFGINPVDVPVVGGSRANVAKVFMGVAFTCGAEEDVIAFFDRGLPVEYELARSIRVVARTKRKRVGVLTTQANLFGGFDFNTFQSKPAWPVVGELKKQYEVVRIAATDSITEQLDGLLVALPSSLSQEEMNHLQDYIERGTPAMLLLDPLPIVDIGLSPSEESGANVNPFMRNRGPQPKPKGGIGQFLDALGIRWNKAQIVWDGYNPHPDLANLPPEVVFVGRGNQNPMSFNDAVHATAGLQELVLLFPGALDPAAESTNTFEPLVRSSFVSGSLPYGQLVQRSFFGVTLAKAQAPHYATNIDYTLAAHVRGDSTAASKINVIAVADLDFISDQFFEIRKRGIGNLNFDNITAFLNMIDVLVGDDSFIDLRSRRVKHRTLETVENRIRAYSEQRATEERAADAEAQAALAEAQARLDRKVAEVRQRADLDAQTKQIMARNLQEAESRRFEAAKATIEATRNARVERAKETMESQIHAIESNIKTMAGLLPPIPIFVVGIVIFVKRRRREHEGAAAARRLRS